MSTVFSTDVVLQYADPLVHAGMESVGTDIVFDGPAYLVHREGIPQSGLLFFNEAYKMLCKFFYSGRLQIHGVVILHSIAPVEFVESALTGLLFKNADDVIVAYIDTDGNLHTLFPIVQQPSLILETAGAFTYTTDATLNFALTTTYIIDGTDAAYPIFQVVDKDDNCLFKIQQDGTIETTSIVVSADAGATTQDIVFGSYRF